MVNDVEGTWLAFLFFSIVLFVPGYVVGWLANILSFRTASHVARVLLAVCLSFCVSPAVVNLFARLFGLRACAIPLLMCLVLFFILVGVEWRHRQGLFPICRSAFVGLGLVGFAVMVLVLSQVDLQLGMRLYPTAAVYDHGVRTAFIESVVRTGVPPANPLFYAGGYVASRYYYFWNVLCALPVKLIGADPRVSLYASAIWSALGIASLVPLYFKYFLNEKASLRRKSLIGIALLAVTGFDLVPTFLMYWAGRVVMADMEWWNAQQITSWADAVIWVPHHVASLVACFGGFLVLWDAKQQQSRWRTCIDVATAALAFSGAAGMSVYVTLGFTFFFVVWTLRYIVQRTWSTAGVFALTGILTIIVSIPYLGDLRAPATHLPQVTEQRNGVQSASAGGGELTVGPRTIGFTPKGHIWTIPVQLLEAGVIYFFEFGFYAFVAGIQFRRLFSRKRSLTEEEWASRYLFGCVFLLATFVRSSVISTNDFGLRSMMLPQFVLLLWGAELIHELWFENAERQVAHQRLSVNWKPVLLAALVFGVLGTAYQLIMLRLAMLLADRGAVEVFIPDEPRPQHIGSDTYEFRAAFESLNHKLASDSIVQYNPFAEDSNALLAYNRYQMVAGNPGCGLAFGGTLSACESVRQKLARIFSLQGFHRDGFRDLDQLCDESKVDVLIAHRSDPLWDQPQSWVWTRKPLVENKVMRAFRCGTSQN